MRPTRWPAGVAFAMVLASLVAPAMAGEPYPVEFRFVNNQKNNDMKGVVHGLAGWVHVPRNDSRSIEHKFGSGNTTNETSYYYDVTVTENRDGGAIFCSWHIEVRQQRTYHNDQVSYCTIKSGYPSGTRTCLGEVQHEQAAGACAFLFNVGDP